MHRLTVGVPQADDLVLGLSGFGGSGHVTFVERRAIISFEKSYGVRCSKHHAIDCG